MEYLYLQPVCKIHKQNLIKSSTFFVLYLFFDTQDMPILQLE